LGIHVLSDLKDKKLEQRIVDKGHKASVRTGLPFKAIFMVEFAELERCVKKGHEEIKIQDEKVPVTAFIGPTGTPSILRTTNGTIFYCHGIPGAVYNEPTEEKMAHELLHQDYDNRNIGAYVYKIVEHTKGVLAKWWIREAIEWFVDSNIDGYVTFLYGAKYEKDIEKYCKSWVHDMTENLAILRENNNLRMINLFKACSYYARVSSLEGEISGLMEKLTRVNTELKKVLYYAELYRSAFERGKTGYKAEKVDVEKFHKKIARA